MDGFIVPVNHTPEVASMSSIGGATKKALVDWTKILGRCTPKVRKTILETRSHHEELRRQIGELKATIPKLDWTYYQAKLPKSMEGFVREMEASVSDFKPQKINTEPLLDEWKSEREGKLEASKQFITNLENEIEKLEGKLNQLKNAKPVDEITVDDVYEMRPEWKQQFDDAIKQDCWTTDPSYDPADNKAPDHSHH